MGRRLLPKEGSSHPQEGWGTQVPEGGQSFPGWGDRGFLSQEGLPYTFATFDNVDVLITNAALPEDLQALAEEKNVRIIDVSKDA